MEPSNPSPTPAAAGGRDKEKGNKVEMNEVNGSGGRGKTTQEEEAVVATTMAST